MVADEFDRLRNAMSQSNGNNAPLLDPTLFTNILRDTLGAVQVLARGGHVDRGLIEKLSAHARKLTQVLGD